MWDLHINLSRVIEELIRSKSYVSFLIGRQGEFDEYAASVIKSVRKGLGTESSDISLVLPYVVADIEFYEKYYDDIIIPDGVEKMYPKQAIRFKNRWMIEKSDLVIVNVERESGGAYDALQYARKLNKSTVNLCDMKRERKI